MLIVCLNIRLWKESILLAIFDVTVHSSELYMKMDAANVLKVLTLVSILICLYLFVWWSFFILSIVNIFLLFMSFSVSSFDPSSLQSRQSGVLSFTLSEVQFLCTK